MIVPFRLEAHPRGPPVTDRRTDAGGLRVCPRPRSIRPGVSRRDRTGDRRGPDRVDGRRDALVATVEHVPAVAGVAVPLPVRGGSHACGERPVARITPWTVENGDVRSTVL
jgi:hypothetical protein